MSSIDDLRLPERPKLPERTQEWFEAWKSDPITRDWTPAQCQYLLDTALIHAAVWGQGRFELAGELGRREQVMGLKFSPAKKEMRSDKANVMRLVMSDRERKAKRANA